MKIILGGRGSGKTKKVLELSAENGIPVLCESRERADRLVIKAHGYGLKIPAPVAFEDMNERIKEVYIDEVDLVLEKVLKTKVKLVSINRDCSEDILDIDLR